MQAQRVMAQVDSSGNLTGLPLLPPGQEVIMLLTDQPLTPIRRKPPERLKGTVRINGDLLSTASPTDWEVS